jgi:hypothetical protein
VIVKYYGDKYEWPAFSHRDTFGFAVLEDVPRYAIDSVAVFCVQLRRDHKWWIINRRCDQDHLWEDIGPYDDYETAYFMMKIVGTKE